jgi:pimeloyl-ACP methyl ester carboxylesterase
VSAPAPEHVVIDGRRLEYRWLGPRPATGKTIVFLHEGLGSISQWKDFPDTLCATTGASGLVYNRQGYGGSDPAARICPEFMHREALDVLPQLLDAFTIERPILFGHSDGGSIALIYAGSQHPSPAGLMLEAPHVFVEDVTVASIAALRDAYHSSRLRSRLERHHGGNVDRLFEQWTTVWLSEPFRTWNIEEHLPAIDCPSLVVQGADDEYGTVKQVRAIADGVSGRVETLILDACGHAPHVDQRDRVVNAAAAFMDRLERS